MNSITNDSQVDDAAFGSSGINRLLFVDDDWYCLQVATLEQGLNTPLIGLKVCSIKPAGMKSSTNKTEVLCLYRKPIQCALVKSQYTAADREVHEPWNFIQQ